MTLTAAVALVVGSVAFAAGWSAANMFGPPHEGDRTGQTTPVASGGLPLPGPGPDSTASSPACGLSRPGHGTTRGWDQTPTHPARPRPALYDWEAEGACGA